MNSLNIFLSASDWEGAVVAGLGGLIIVIFMYLFKAAGSKAKEIQTNRAIQNNPNDLKHLIRKGFMEYSSYKFDSAIELFKRALELEPKNKEALGGITCAYHMKSDYTNSEKYANMFIKSDAPCTDDPLIIMIMYINGHLHFMAGRMEEAENCKNNAKIFASAYKDIENLINKLNWY